MVRNGMWICIIKIYQKARRVPIEATSRDILLKIA